MLDDSLIRASSLAHMSEEYAWHIGDHDEHGAMQEILGLLADLIDLSLTMAEQ
jgi:hypothetical protein